MPRPKGLGRDNCGLLYYWGAAFLACVVFMLVVQFQEAKAQVPGTCKSIEDLSQQVSKDYPGQRVVPLTGDSAATFMTRWNAIPPRSNVIATELLILFHDRYGVTKVAMFRNGCAFTVYQIPIKSVQKLLKGLTPTKLHKIKGINA